MTRPSWDATWAALAQDIAKRSRCDRAKIGSVIVDKTNRVLAVSYNGPPAGWNPPKMTPDSTCIEWCQRCKWGPTEQTATSYEDCPSNHSEINGLLVTDRSQREGGSIFVTGSVCLSCAKAIGNSGLARVVVVGGAVDGSDKHRRPDRSIEFLRRCGLYVHSIDLKGGDENAY